MEAVDDYAAELEAKLAALGTGSPPDPWGDTEELRAHREKWPELTAGTEDDLVQASFGFGSVCMTLGRIEQGSFLRFFTHPKTGERALALRSDCGRFAEAWKLSRTPWRIPARGFFDSWRLRGSLESVPVGLRTLTKSMPFVALAPVGQFLSMLDIGMTEGRWFDCAFLGIPGADLSKPVLDAIASAPRRRARVFLPVDAKSQRTAVRWVEQLRAVGCTADWFDFRGRGVLDLNGLAALEDREEGGSIFPA